MEQTFLGLVLFENAVRRTAKNEAKIFRQVTMFLDLFLPPLHMQNETAIRRVRS